MGSTEISWERQTDTVPASPSSSATGNQPPTQSPEELQEEGRKIRRLRMVVNMVTQVIAQDQSVTVEEAIGDGGRQVPQGTCHVSRQGTRLQSDLLASFATPDARALPHAMRHQRPRPVLFVFVGRKPEGDRSPKQPRPHLHGQMAIVVGVPDPDVAPVLHHAGRRSGLHAHGLE